MEYCTCWCLPLTHYVTSQNMETGLKCLFIWGITLKYDFIYTQFEGSSVSVNQMVMPCAALFNCLSPFLEWFLQHASVYSHSWCDHVQCWLGTYARRTQSSGKYYEWLVSWNVTGQFSGDDWWLTEIVATRSTHFTHFPRPCTHQNLAHFVLVLKIQNLDFRFGFDFSTMVAWINDVYVM